MRDGWQDGSANLGSAVMIPAPPHASRGEAPPTSSRDVPHYHGHRARLRARLRDGGADALPDYELLEMALFGANSRSDTKALAKKLIDKFGSFASVISAPRE